MLGLCCDTIALDKQLYYIKQRISMAANFNGPLISTQPFSTQRISMQLISWQRISMGFLMEGGESLTFYMHACEMKYVCTY